MTRKILLIGIPLALFACVTCFGIIWTTCRIYVPEDKCAVLVRKMGGDPLPAGQMVATDTHHLGIQEEVLGPGRYFRNPILWDWEIHPLTVIPSGNPGTWEWPYTLGRESSTPRPTGQIEFKGEFPKIGVVTRKVGKDAPPGQLLVKRDSGTKGIWEEVLTPGTYKMNPYVYEIELHPAIVIPAGFVGVVTNLFGAAATTDTQPQQPELTLPAAAMIPVTEPGDWAAITSQAGTRILANPGERGTQRDVLQPGIYFINPKLQKVTLIEVGYNEYSQISTKGSLSKDIAFPSDTGYTINVGVTVVWGIHPKHAAEIINEFGNVDGVVDKVIGPQLRSICRNIGSTYAARDFIQGQKREQFQKALTEELRRVCQAKNIELLLALVREIEVHSPVTDAKGIDSGVDLKRTIQQSYIANEQKLTNDKQREAETVKAQLDTLRKNVDIARENVKADTRILVANTKVEGEKTAAEIAAQAALEVAGIQQQVAELEARRIEILGQARADVEKMKNASEAEGYKRLVQAFGSPQAYNLYTFAQNFKPESIKLFFAGEGTFWTDLTRFEDAGAAKLLQAKTSEPSAQKPESPKAEKTEPAKK